MTNAIGAAAPLPRDAWNPAPRPEAEPVPVPAPPVPETDDPAIRPAANLDDGQRIAAAVEQLRATEAGRGVADFLASNRVDVRVLPDPDFAARFPGAGAVYDPKTRDISIPRSALGSSALVTTLAHEGKHAQDFADRPHWMLQSIGMIGGTAKDGAKALVTFRNPATAWLDSLTARQNEDEVTAYHLQAQVAHELGRNESSWALGQAEDGAPLPIEQIRENVATDELYRMDPLRRFVLGAGLGVAATSAAAVGVNAIIGKVAPNSFVGRNSWMLHAAGVAATAAWVAGDMMRSSRLSEADARTPAAPAL